MNYYNDFDKYCCEWLRNLIAAGELPPGDVDDRSITDVQPDELRKYDQCHFFCGIGGWPLSLRLAGAANIAGIWTGSCPCQPYSSAGKGLGDADPRNLWPQFFRLIRECRPERVFGEQVEAAIKHGWLDGISADLEAEDYAVGAVVLGAHSVGAPHIRQRLYWVACSLGNADFAREDICSEAGSKRSAVGEPSGIVPLAVANSLRHNGREDSTREREPCISVDAEADHAGSWLADAPVSECGQREQRLQQESGCGDGTARVEQRTAGGMGDTRDGAQSERTRHSRRSSMQRTPERTEPGVTSPWSLVYCRDNKVRRVSAQSSDEPLAYGVPRKLGPEFAGVAGMAKLARRNRVGRLRGYGNAICVETAVEFITAYFEVENATQL